MSEKKQRKTIQKIITISLLFTIVCPTLSVWADDEEPDEINENEIQNLVLESVAQPSEEPKLNARATIIYDRTTKEMIWGKKETSKRAMASTTKIMTAMIVLENSNLSDTVTISKKAAGTGGSRLKIVAGDKITVRDLLYGLMLRSRK